MKKILLLIVALVVVSACGKKKTPLLWLFSDLAEQNSISNNSSYTTTVPFISENSNQNTNNSENNSSYTTTVPFISENSNQNTNNSENTNSSSTNAGNSGLTITFDNTNFSLQTNPSGAFEGVVLAGPDANTNAFGSVVPSCANVSCLLDRILLSISNWSQIATNGYSLISRQPLTNAILPTELVHLQLTLKNESTANNVRNDLIALIGTVDGSGNVSNFPEDPNGANLDTQFRVIIQATQDTNHNAVILVGVTTVSNYSNVEDELGSLTDGTNVGPSQNPENFIDTLYADEPPKADFLFVVDNSGSMSEEQQAVIHNSLLFFDRLNTLGVDFQIGTITTDNSNLRGIGFTNNRSQFENDINAGINGSGRESCIYYAEKALSTSSPNRQGAILTNGKGNLGSISSYPQNNSKLAVICITDESDAYTKWDDSQHTNQPKFDYNDNIFKDKQITFYSIMPLDSSGQYGSCVGVNGNANVYYNFDQSVFSIAALNPQTLAVETGGAVSSICGENYGAFLQQLADQVAAQASSYALSRIPISSTIRVYINGTEIVRTSTPTNGQTGYKYISSENKIVFTGRIPSVGSLIQIAYQSYQN